VSFGGWWWGKGGVENTALDSDVSWGALEPCLGIEEPLRV